MTLNNDDEIRDFDERLKILHSVLIAEKPDIFKVVCDVMRKLIFHDWPEWAQSHRWQIPDFAFEAFEPDDAEFLRRFTVGAVTVLKSNGASGVKNLQSYIAIYLQQRGIRVAAAKSETVTANDVAQFAGILRTSIGRKRVSAWGNPVRGEGTKNHPFEWSRQTITPILQTQWPKKDWSKF